MSTEFTVFHSGVNNQVANKQRRLFVTSFLGNAVLFLENLCEAPTPTFPLDGRSSVRVLFRVLMLKKCRFNSSFFDDNN